MVEASFDYGVYVNKLPSRLLSVLYIPPQPVQHFLIEFFVVVQAHCRGNKDRRFVRYFFIIERIRDEKLVAFVLGVDDGHFVGFENCWLGFVHLSAPMQSS